MSTDLKNLSFVPSQSDSILQRAAKMMADVLLKSNPPVLEQLLGNISNLKTILVISLFSCTETQQFSGVAIVDTFGKDYKYETLLVCEKEKNRQRWAQHVIHGERDTCVFSHVGDMKNNKSLLRTLATNLEPSGAMINKCQGLCFQYYESKHKQKRTQTNVLFFYLNKNKTTTNKHDNKHFPIYIFDRTKSKQHETHTNANIHFYCLLG